MNKIFKVKHNSAGQSVVTSEIAKSRSKGRVVASALAVAGLMVSSGASAAGINSFATQGGVADAVDGIAIGSGAKALSVNEHTATAIGKNTAANGINALAVGTDANATGDNTIAIGTTAQAIQEQNIAIGANAKAEGLRSLAIGLNTTATGDGAYAIGELTQANGDYSVALGNGATTSGVHSVALMGATATGDYSFASHHATASGEKSFAFGENAQSEGFKSVALFGQAKGDRSFALGIDSITEGDDSTAVGHAAYSTTAYGLALGAMSLANTDAGVQGYLGYLADGKTDATWQSTMAAASVGNVAAGVTRQITSVAAGTQDTDAVNVAQLKAAIMNAGGSTVVAAGDGIKVDPSTKDTTTTYTVSLDDATKQSITKAQADAAAAQTAVDALKPAVEQNTADIASLKDTKADKADVDAKNALQDAIIDGKADKTALAATDAKLAALDAVAVTYDDTTKDTITLGDTDGTTITNVKAGAISANSTDAVNGNQLFDVYNYVNQGNDAMRQHINTVEDKLQAGIAGSNASASLPQVRGNGKSMMAFGLGGFQDKGALAIGYSRSSDNGKTVFKAHLNADTEKKFGGGLGLGFEW